MEQTNRTETTETAAKQPLIKPALQVMAAQAGGILLALIFCFGLAVLMTGMGLLFCIPLVLLCYSVPLYNSMWGLGHSDGNKAHFGHIVLDPWRGVKISLIANIPWLCSGVLFFLSKCGLFWNFTVIYKIINAEVWPIMNAVQVFAGQDVSMYLPDFAWWQVVVCALLPLLPVAVAHLGYSMGTRDISIVEKVLYVNKKKKAEDPPKSTYEQYRARQKHSAAPQEPEKKPSLLQKILYQNDDKK